MLGRLRRLPREVGKALLAGTRDISHVRTAAQEAAGRIHGFDVDALDPLLGSWGYRGLRDEVSPLRSQLV